MNTFFLQDGRGSFSRSPDDTGDAALTYPAVARQMSDSHVQVYDLDEVAAPALSSATYPPLSSPASRYSLYKEDGVPSSVDPHVTIYPFDDQSAPRRRPKRRMVLLPPSEQYSPLKSPFNGPIQRPTPLLAPRPDADFPVPFSMPLPFENPKLSGALRSRIYYRHGSSDLDQTGKQVVGFVARKGGPISVEGYASERAETNDPVERSIVNLEMSLERAFKVSSALIRSGVPASSIETKAYGATRPAAPLAGTDRESSSRRVEIRTELHPEARSGAETIPDLLRY